MRTPISVVCLCSVPFSVCNLSLYCTFSQTGTGRTRLTESKEAEVAKLTLPPVAWWPLTIVAFAGWQTGASPSRRPRVIHQVPGDRVWWSSLRRSVHNVDRACHTNHACQTRNTLYLYWIAQSRQRHSQSWEGCAQWLKLAKAGDVGGDGGPEAKLNEVLRKQVQDLTDISTDPQEKRWRTCRVSLREWWTLTMSWPKTTIVSKTLTWQGKPHWR